MATDTAPAGRPAIPNDPKLQRLAELFDSDRAWARYCDSYGTPEDQPDRIKIEHFVYRPGVRAAVGYVSEKKWDGWVAEEHWAIELLADGQERIFRYPDDPYLPGLAHAADPLRAHDLLPRHVRLQPHRLAIEKVRYRPTTKAVLRHQCHWHRKDAPPITLYVRVMPPGDVERLLTAGRLAERSAFALPRLAGCDRESGIAWLAAVPGKTVRRHIAEGSAPRAGDILDALAAMWDAPAGEGHALDVSGGFRHSERVLTQALPEGAQHPTLSHLLGALRPFVESWRPSTLAHNDFYDDQMIVTPEGRIALVDFEEAGPGDPLLDVATMLAHLRWMTRFVQEDGYQAFHNDFRQAALDRMRWEPRALDVAEAYELFRLASNPIRRFKDSSLKKVETVLSMARDTLES